MKVVMTLLVDAAQGLLEMVHLNVYVAPAVPLNVEVGLEGVLIVPPDPEIMLQAPVPTEGVLAASETDVKPQVAALV